MHVYCAGESPGANGDRVVEERVNCSEFTRWVTTPSHAQRGVDEHVHVRAVDERVQCIQGVRWM